MVVAFITRGICPAECLANVYEQVDRHGEKFVLISGKALVDAKNEAVEHALENQEDLLLVEDDVVAPNGMWDRVASTWHNQNTILFAEAVERYGRINVRYTKEGELLWTGNVFTRIPYGILTRLEKPIFRAWDFILSGDGSQMIDRGPAKHGHHSDAYFWWTVKQLDPKPEIVNIGRVDHMITPYNSGKVTEHSKPYRMKPFADTTGAKKTA